MNKQIRKIIIVLSGFIFGIPFLINNLIFLIANKKNKSFETFNFYNWRLGNIHYKVKGIGKPILLIHGIGIGCSHSEWDNNLDELSKSYKVFAIDLLGFGNSDKPKTTYTAYMYATLINDFIKNVIKLPTYVISSSNSAAFTVSAANLEPKNFRKLILIEPTGVNDKIPENKDKFLRKLIELPIFGTFFYIFASSKSNIKKFLDNNVFFSKEQFVSKKLIDIFYYKAHLGNSNNKYPFASFISNFMNTDIKPMLQNLKLQTYFVWGENTLINPIENMGIIENIKPKFKYAIFEETRLFPHYENPVEFNKLTKEFFK